MSSHQIIPVGGTQEPDLAAGVGTDKADDNDLAFFSLKTFLGRTTMHCSAT